MNLEIRQQVLDKLFVRIEKTRDDLAAVLEEYRSLSFGWKLRHPVQTFQLGGIYQETRAELERMIYAWEQLQKEMGLEQERLIKENGE
jgi:hypothetical protein